jgi:energy-coupling factor transport system substrate-specific component
VTNTGRVQRASVAIRVSLRSRVVIVMASFLGFVAFLWPFVVAPHTFGDVAMAPLMFGALLVLVLAIVLSEIADGGIDAKAIAMLGVLSAIGAALRPLGAGTAGIETVFFTLVIAGRVFGAGFGFTLGCTTLFASALLTSGVGPWMPYQMFGCAWVGLFAGLLPPVKGKAEVLMLAVYGAVSAYFFGFMINLSFWPFSVQANSGISYLPGASFAFNVHRYLVFDGTTSLGWDTGRAVTNFVLILLVGPAMLATFRRAARRAAFEAPVSFSDAADPLDPKEGHVNEVSGTHPVDRAVVGGGSRFKLQGRRGALRPPRPDADH